MAVYRRLLALFAAFVGLCVDAVDRSLRFLVRLLVSLFDPDVVGDIISVSIMVLAVLMALAFAGWFSP